MDATSPIFAALGVFEFDALNDLAHWLDAFVEPAADTPGRPADRSWAPGRSAGGEG